MNVKFARVTTTSILFAIDSMNILKTEPVINMILGSRIRQFLRIYKIYQYITLNSTNEKRSPKKLKKLNLNSEMQTEKVNKSVGGYTSAQTRLRSAIHSNSINI